MKIRTRKRTATEKAADKAKKAKKKDLRKDKRERKKDARDAKKDVRQSDLNKEERKAAIDAINSSKKADVKDIKEELREAKQGLEIILPVKTANVALVRQDLRDIDFLDNTGVVRPIEIEDAFTIIQTAYNRAIELAETAHDYLKPFVVLSRRATWVTNWNSDELLVKWFGVISHHNNASDVNNRLSSVVDRLNKKVTIRLHPQRNRAVTPVGLEGTRAQNNGTFFEPKTFKVFPFIIESNIDDSTKAVSIDEIAAILIHELIHLWFNDQKLDGETVYGDDLAMQLAIDNPKKARKSAENYEWFCLEASV